MSEATPRGRVLVVDDDRGVRTALSVNLTKHGLDVVLASNPAEARGLLADGAFDVVLTDVRMPGGTGLELLEHVKALDPDVAVVVMTGFGSVNDAVSALKAGAVDYIIKPIEKRELLVILDKALDNRALKAEVRRLRRQVDARDSFERLIGQTPVMQRLYREVEAVADTDATVLIEGPTGTGKELISHALHARSRRAEGPFVRVNCAAIPSTLIESELFGHERGAFTGAVRQHIGKFEQAHGGTLLLDEIGEIDLHMQVKLLRVLENGELSRVGGSGTLSVDVRVIAATNRDLREEARQGRFREDLYYRLRVFHLQVPSLAERRDDIPLLVDHFLDEAARRADRPRPNVSRAAMDALLAHPWPGNIRELKHTLERAMILCRGETIDHIDWLEAPRATPAAPVVQPGEPMSLKDALDATERALVLEALQACDGVQAEAARRLGLSRSNLNYRIQRLGLRKRGATWTDGGSGSAD
ncbi:MAG: sigma-54-dependent Fis family transcriptional regulator [Alphaproteobacteria bacterium]|nr:sigma-54-dependent Fis family transcriptional regulator [Alphaproteobacteria bacterium]